MMTKIFAWTHLKGDFSFVEHYETILDRSFDRYNAQSIQICSVELVENEFCTFWEINSISFS